MFANTLTFAQKQTRNATTDELISRKDTSYVLLNTALSPIKNDTTALLKFIAKSKSVNYHEGTSIGLNQLAIYFRNTSLYDRSIQIYEEAIKEAELCTNIDFKVSCLNMLGVVYRRTEKIREALDNHKLALELVEKSERTDENAQRNRAISRNSIGNIYLTLNQPDLAESEFSQSMEIEKKIGNKLGMAINYQNLGGIASTKGELNKALNFFKNSLALNEEINSDLGRVICKNSIGEIYLKQGLATKALALIEPTIKQAEELGDMYYLAATKTNMGWALLELKKYEQAEAFIRESLGIAIKHKLQYYVAENYGLLSEINESRGNFKEALEYQKLYYDNQEEYLNEKNKLYMYELIIRYDTDKKKNQIELLEKQNELVNLKLNDNRKLFSASIILLGLLSVIFFILYRQNKLKNEKEILHLEQTMLRSQMNPHFIFNSLNSIKLYIINNEKDKAVYYLNKFSKLIRSILTRSREKDITLKDELETMELYMNIENIRFSNKIHFELIVDPDISTSQIKVPSMILQPFLENAIWHGLSSKTGEKNVKLSVKKINDKKIEIQIEDNGIGREKSREIKLKKTINTQSIGIYLTEQRLQNYFKNMAGEHSLSFQDLKDENGEPTGTNVILKLPVEHISKIES